MIGPLPDFPRIKNPAVAFAMPTRRTVHPKTMMCLMSALNTTRDMGWQTCFIDLVGTHVHKARNLMVQKMMSPKMRQQFTHLLMVDSDMAFRPDVALRLMSAHLPIVGATAVKGQEPRLPCVWTYHKTPQGAPDVNNCDWQKTWDAIDEARFERYPATLQVDAIGTGVILIDLRVFHRIEAPWFFYDADNDAMTSDVYFCMKAQEAGIPVVVDAGYEVGHFHQHAFDMAHFRANRTQYEAMMSHE